MSILANLYKIEINQIYKNKQKSGEQKKEQGNKIGKRTQKLFSHISQQDEFVQYNFGEIWKLLEDYPESFKWFKLSADQDNPLSKLALVDFYWNGLGIEPNKTQALSIIYDLVQNHNNPEARFRLAKICEQGEMIPKDNLLIIMMRLRILRSNLKSKQIEETKSYIKERFECVNDGSSDLKYSQTMEVDSLIKKHKRFWKNCPEPTTIQDLLTLKSMSISDVLTHLDIIFKAKDDFMCAFLKYCADGFMITCLKSKNPVLEEQMKTSNLIRSWTYGSTTYYTFGSTYIRKFDSMLAFIDPNASWRTSRDYLLKWHQDLLQDSKISFVNNDDCFRVINRNIQFFQQLIEIPEELIMLLNKSAPVRNIRFDYKYPCFERDENTYILDPTLHLLFATNIQSDSDSSTEFNSDSNTDSETEDEKSA